VIGRGICPTSSPAGKQQRVAIARALVNDPAILLADKPTDNFDSQTALDIMATLRALNRERGVTVVLVTHERDLAELADRIITIRDGQILSDLPAAHTATTLQVRALPPVQPLRERRYASQLEASMRRRG
jgi:macrolide transport system ATP-binding/permease protein